MTIRVKPFSDDALRVAVAVHVGRVDEVAAMFYVIVHQLDCCGVIAARAAAILVCKQYVINLADSLLCYIKFIEMI